MTMYFLSDMHMDMHGASGNDDNWGLRKFTKFSPFMMRMFIQGATGVDIDRYDASGRIVAHLVAGAAEASRRRSSASSTLGSREGRAFLHQLVAMTTRCVLKVDLDPGGRRGAQEVHEVLFSSRT